MTTMNEERAQWAVPGKKVESVRWGYRSLGYAEGWNACVDALLAAAPATPAAQGAVPHPLRYTSDGELAECPCCGSLDVGGVHDTVNCYGCGLQITKPRPLQNAVDAWNKRAMLAAAPTVKAEQVPDDQAYDRNAERLTAEALGTGSGINMAATSIDELFDEPAPSLPAAGSAGEEVEVVGYRFFHVDHGYIFRRTHIYEGNPSLEAHGLMTVAQHQRIVAAQAQPAAQGQGEMQRLRLVEMIDAAMVEMQNISPPLRRSECERLIRAALAASAGQEVEK